MRTYTLLQDNEELVSTCEYQGALAISEEITRTSTEKAHASHERRVQMEKEIQSLVENTITSLTEGGALDEHTKDQLLTEYVKLRDTETLREQQLSQIKSRMTERMRVRREKMQSRQQSKRAEVWWCLHEYNTRL